MTQVYDSNITIQLITNNILFMTKKCRTSFR